VGGSTQVRIEGQLGEPVRSRKSIKISRHDRGGADPTHQADFFADMGGAQITAEVGAFQLPRYRSREGLLRRWYRLTVQAEIKDFDYIEAPV